MNLKKNENQAMATKLSDVMEKIPPPPQARIQARTEKLIAENIKLQDIKKARNLTYKSTV